MINKWSIVNCRIWLYQRVYMFQSLIKEQKRSCIYLCAYIHMIFYKLAGICLDYCWNQHCLCWFLQRTSLSGWTRSQHKMQIARRGELLISQMIMYTSAIIILASREKTLEQWRFLRVINSTCYACSLEGSHFPKFIPPVYPHKKNWGYLDLNEATAVMIKVALWPLTVDTPPSLSSLNLNFIMNPSFISRFTPFPVIHYRSPVR